MEKKGKDVWALVLPGGGLSCAIVVGIIAALTRMGAIFDIVVASSGDAGTASYLVSGQFDKMSVIWGLPLACKEFINWFRRPVINIDYLIDQIFGQDHKLDLVGLKRSKTKLFVSATNAKTGEVFFFSNHAHWRKWLDILRATKAIPIPWIYGKKVRINGEEYVDGAISAPIGANVQKAIDEGATKIIAIKDISGSGFSSFFLAVYSVFVDKGIRKAILNYCRNKNTCPQAPSGIDVFYIKPDQSPIRHTLDNNLEHIEAAKRKGSRIVENDAELRSFLEG